MTIDSIILEARLQKCSDVHLSEGLPLYYRIHGALQRTEFQPSATEAHTLIQSMIPRELVAPFEAGQDADFAICSSDGNRQRVNVFRQQGKLAAAIRLLNDTIPTLDALGLPPVLRQFVNKKRGLVLVTGPTGSGKSTTLASMIDSINESRSEHIITVEDPIEYLYEQKKAVVHQREVGRDVSDFAASLRSALREDPDVILIGEMRDYETISAALTAAETGHFVLSTLHTTGAAQTIDRIIDACPPHAQHQIRSQLAGILCGIVTQCLIRTADGKGRCVATEVLVGTDGVLNLIREDKCHQLGSLMQAGAAVGMHSLNSDLTRLVRQNKITKEAAYEYSNDPKNLADYLK